jgi:hypothetical protein
LVSKHQTDLAPAVVELAEDAERLLDRPGSDDLVVSPIALAQLGLDAVMRSRAFLDRWGNDYDELDHRLHGLAAGGEAVVEGATPDT